MKAILIFGAGGFAREVTWLIEDINRISPQWKILGYVVENPKEAGKTIRGFPVLPGLEYAVKTILTAPEPCYATFAVGSQATRRNILNQIKKFKGKLVFPNLFHPAALKDDSTLRCGQGNIITAGATLTADVTVGSFNLLNTGCILSHDVEIGDFCNIGPHAILNGKVKVCDDATIGAGGVILSKMTIGKGSTVVLGAVVASNVPDNTVVAGNPSRIVRNASDSQQQE